MTKRRRLSLWALVVVLLALLLALLGAISGIVARAADMPVVLAFATLATILVVGFMLGKDWPK